MAFAKESYFGGPNDRNVDVERTLVRWNRPLRVSIEGPGAARYRDQITGHLADFTKLSGLQAEFVEAPGEANLVIELAGNKTYQINGEVTQCVARFRRSNAYIKRVDIRIGVTKPAAVERCLAHELYHAFGLKFHSVAAASVLSPVHGNVRPTAADRLALSMLYDSRLNPGATLEEAAPVIRDMTAKVAGDFGEYWIALLPSEARLQVPRKVTKGFVPRHFKRWFPEKHVTYEVAFWSGSVVPEPVAVVFLASVDPRYTFNAHPPLRKSVANVATIFGKPTQFGTREQRKGRQGFMDTIGFRMAGSECLGFRQGLDSYTGATGDTALLFGYFCADPGAPIDMKIVGDLLQNTQIRGAN